LFNYFAPYSFEDASKILKKHKNAYILAGGTDLLVNIRSGKTKPDVVVDLKRIKGLNYIKKDKNYIRIGTLTDMNEIASSNILKGPYEILKRSASVMGCFEIRNRATIGGNIVNASPGADTLCPLTVLKAKVVIYNSKRERTVPIEKFLKGVNKVDLKKGEILKEVLIPLYDKNCAGFYFRRQRTKGMDLASFNAAIFVINKNNISERKIRIAIGTVSPTPYINKKVESLLNRKTINSDLVKKSVDIINSEIAPRKTSLRATPEYKKLMVEVFLNRSLKSLRLIR